MKILALETSCNIASVSLLEGNQPILQLTSDAVRSHSETILPLLDNLLTTSNTTLADVDLFACDNGPGSFTGIRIGLSTIKAFCDVLHKPCIAVSSLEALAYTAGEPDGYIASMIDAKHGNIYSGVFDTDGGTYRPVCDFAFASIDEFLDKLRNLKKNIFFVGNCGILYKDMIQSTLGNNAKILPDTLVYANQIGLAAFDKFERRPRPKFARNKRNVFEKIKCRKLNAERTHMNITITQMTENDLTQINITEFDDFWNANILAQDFASPTSYYIIAKRDIEIVGFAGLNFILDEAHIANIAVKKGFRRLKIGSKLLEELIKKSQETSSLLTLEVSEVNEPAINLYKKYDFSLVGKRKKYYNNTYDAYIMTKFFKKI